MGRESAAEGSARKVTPNELTEGFQDLGLKEGDQVVLHASLRSIGDVDGGAAMVLHRLLRALGKEGTLVMPAFTSVARHSSMHDEYTKHGCWCEGNEGRHVPFIPELQPDKNLGEIAHRLCSWPSSRRSHHPAYSFVSVGKETDNLVRNSSLLDPLQPLRSFLNQEPKILTLGVGLDSVSALHLPEQRYLPAKFVRERALTITSKGQTWVEVVAVGCSSGFEKLASHLGRSEFKETRIGSANSCLYSMKTLVHHSEELFSKDPSSLTCGRSECLSCCASAKRG
jgi:aminoglycoside 3-N-acetyltransferase